MERFVCRDFDCWKTKFFFFARPFLCNHSNGTRREQKPVLNINYVYFILPSSFLSCILLFFLVCVLFILFMLRELDDSLHLWNFPFVLFFVLFCLSFDPELTRNIPPRESRNWCRFCFCPSPNHTGMNG